VLPLALTLDAPAGHAAQADAPGAELYVLTGQGVHVAEFGAEE